jgi:N-acetyl sugar amidotransferase
MECSRCVLDDSIPDLTLDDNGECNYCKRHDALDAMYPTGKEGERRFNELIAEIKKAGSGKPFDCVVGVSGGRDSSWLLHNAVIHGLRPIAVHYDNGWDHVIATRNIDKLTKKLEVPLVNYRVKQEEVDDIIRAFLLSHTQDAEAATDLALVKILFQAAETYGIKYILDGHSFRTEGMAPIGWSYMDGRYVKAVHAAHGKVPLKTYPSLSLRDQIRYALMGIKRPRPLYYLDYHPQYAHHYLEDKYGWEWYGGHHMENTYTAFFDYYYRFNKLGYDGRMVELSALVRSGQMTRADAKAELNEPTLPPDYEELLVETIKRVLRFNDETFAFIMNQNLYRSSKDWPTYKTWFKRLKPLFWLMVKTGRIPETFYMKYCK